MYFVTGVIIIITTLNIIIYYLRKHQEEDYGESSISSMLLSDQVCRHFSLAEIRSATQNFDEALVLGRGGFGKVYKGIIDNWSRPVAIKRLDFGSNQGAPEFRTEIEMLSKFRHSHLVSLIGYCKCFHEMIIVYEYMPGGTLSDKLYKIRRSDGDNSSHLCWVQRLKICIGAARGLDYLHTGTSIQHRVIHRDVKSSNILLDENWEAKISDFGLSKIGPTNQPCTHVSTNVKGTFGYLDPEYVWTGRLTRKSDVYSFGVVLFEVLCGRPAMDVRLEEEQRSLARWAKQCIREGRVHQIVDPSLWGSILDNCLRDFVQIADQCLHKSSKRRPTMAEVVSKLEFALSLQETTDFSIATLDISSYDREYDNQEKVDLYTELEVGNAGKVGENDEQIDRIMQLDSASDLSDIKPAKRMTFVKKVRLFFSTKPRYDIFAGKVPDPLRSSFHQNAFSGLAFKKTKISILAFEVANTIAKGLNLMQSLSEENIQFLKKEILHSEGVQQLVSTDMTELLRIAAADKRDEFEVFSREVVRFGDLCKDPQWHNLGRSFSRLDLDPATNKQLREEAEISVLPLQRVLERREITTISIQDLTTLAHNTSEVYHAFDALGRFEQDYRRKLEEVESLHLPRNGESFMILRSELKHYRKHVMSLKRKSFWTKSLEEVVEKLVDIVTFIHQAILDAFGDNVVGSTLIGKETDKKPERLGVAGLALHYANLITQIDEVASFPTFLPPNIRDTLYNGLPTTIKTVLRSHLQTLNSKEVLTIPQIKAEMEKTLQWLVPVATDTIKAHQGFGWVGEWASTGNEFGKKTTANTSLVRLQTLYHADKQKMDQYILDLVTWLHRLVSPVRHTDNLPKSVPVQSPTSKGMLLYSEPQGLPMRNDSKCQRVQLSSEDRNLLEKEMKRKRPERGISKSQELAVVKKSKTKVRALSRSTGCSSRNELEYGNNTRILDVLDGLETSF